jgi:membrane protein implicated in regulation of membrane protease activity
MLREGSGTWLSSAVALFILFLPVVFVFVFLVFFLILLFVLVFAADRIVRRRKTEDIGSGAAA